MLLAADHAFKGIDLPNWAQQQPHEILTCSAPRPKTWMNRAPASGWRGASQNSIYGLPGSRQGRPPPARFPAPRVTPWSHLTGFVVTTRTDARRSCWPGGLPNLDRTHPRILRAVQDDYRDIGLPGSPGISTGSQTQKQAVVLPPTNFAEKGTAVLTLRADAGLRRTRRWLRARRTRRPW